MKKAIVLLAIILVLVCTCATVPVLAASSARDTTSSEGVSYAGNPDIEAYEKNTTSEKSESGLVGGIPIAHLLLFGGGLVLCIGGLVGIKIFNGRHKNRSYNEDE